MFCTNCGTQFDGNFCPGCGTPAVRTDITPQQDTIEEIEELMVYDGSQELFDSAGTPLDLQQVYTVYKDDAHEFLLKYTDYEMEEITSIIAYMTANLVPEQVNMLKRVAMQKKLESKVDAMRKAQQTENEKNGIFCPKCHSSNVQVSLEQAGSKTKKKRNSIVRSAARGTMILGTGGLWALTPKADGKEKSKTNLKTYGICQDCGNTWQMKK